VKIFALNLASDKGSASPAGDMVEIHSTNQVNKIPYLQQNGKYQFRENSRYSIENTNLRGGSESMDLPFLFP